MQLLGQQRARQLPEVHLAQGAHAVNVPDSELRNLLRLKVMAGEKDTKTEDLTWLPPGTTTSDIGMLQDVAKTCESSTWG